MSFLPLTTENYADYLIHHMNSYYNYDRPDPYERPNPFEREPWMSDMDGDSDFDPTGLLTPPPESKKTLPPNDYLMELDRQREEWEAQKRDYRRRKNMWLDEEARKRKSRVSMRTRAGLIKHEREISEQDKEICCLDDQGCKVYLGSPSECVKLLPRSSFPPRIPRNKRSWFGLEPPKSKSPIVKLQKASKGGVSKSRRAKKASRRAKNAQP